MVKIKDIKDFNLEHIFNCGQCFRWIKEEDGSYTGVVFGKIVNMKTTPSLHLNLTQVCETEQGLADYIDLEIDQAEKEDFEKIWKHYLDLGRDYGAIKEQLCKTDPVMAKAVEYGYGIRILNQDKWETIVSFLISQNNNIPRIKKCIETLCENFGENIGVANCVLLFSMGKASCFPIDVWVKRVMNQLYGIDEEDTDAMVAYSEKNFGEYGGIAQQYLFYYIREGQIPC